MKIAGSNKINGKCPSKMKVYEDIESKVTDLGQKEISKEEFQKECMQLINKASPEQYDNILIFLRNTVNSLHLFPKANQEIVSRTLNMEPSNKKIKTQRYVSTKKTSQKTSTTLTKPTQEKCQSVSASLVLTAKSV
ncbi:hypothetical protein TNIN_412761 [Trichonephila inaurata madagascariensis]|uniref:Uncharacterized protein n=1 Tax=Trichonephila inaurata madagascariensis TaxID=2747483 RepID=A0A8X6XHM3_9ARAC|nr:hypothetical protein TNIN_412761 [Trichonephila inaurata madagascariensis]